MTHSIRDVCANLEQFMTAQEVTKNIMENFGEWTEYVRNISDDARENKEIASFFSTVVTNLCRLNDNLKQTINEAKAALNTKQSSDTDRNAALLKRLMKCAVDEAESNVNDNSLYMNYSIYNDGYIGLGFISHISDVQKATCYILDVDRMPDPMLFYARNLRPMHRLPEAGEVFAYHLNQRFMFRAIRCAATYSDAVAVGPYRYYAKFIDVGCTMWIDTSNGFQNHYELDESVQQIPGYAIKCQIVQMPTSYNLMNILHDKVSFRVLKMGNSIVYVELLSQSTNPFLCLEEVGGNNTQLYSYFHWNGTSSNTVSQRIESSLSSRSHGSFDSSCLQGSDGSKAIANHFTDITNTTITPKPEYSKQLSSQCDSSATNWNAHEYRMQQFADTLSTDDENVNERYASGIALDAEEEINVPKIRLPCIGDTVSITVTFVIDVERFYAHIPSCLSSTTIGLKQMQSEINAEHNRRHYQSLQLTPPLNSYVLALYKDSVYRARVVTHYDRMNYQVFYIDYGNCAKVNLNQLFQWDARWDAVPAQVFLCRLHGLRKIRFFDFEAMTALENIVINQTLKAKVINIIGSDDNNSTIVLSVRDIHDVDVTQSMCDKNYAKSM